MEDVLCFSPKDDLSDFVFLVFERLPVVEAGVCEGPVACSLGSSVLRLRSRVDLLRTLAFSTTRKSNH